jgi:8-oxo-dGTP pyrophosphatase MutT (NUDIX family)
MMKNPWKTLNKKLIYSNPWIKLEEHEVLTPGGKEGIYGKVLFQNIAAAVIPLDEELNTWLVGQYRYTLQEHSWEIPMGGSQLGQNVLESAKRELKEETGLMASKWTKIMRVHPSNSVSDEEGFVYLAEDLTLGNTQFEDTEDLEIRKMPLAEAIDKVMKGEITDAISIAGLLKAGKLLDI